MTDHQFEVLLNDVIDIATPHVVEHLSGVHGVRHWRTVRTNGLLLADATKGADHEVVEVFAAVHDSQRLNDWHDPAHGARACEAAMELLDRGAIDLRPKQMKKLLRAMLEHTHERRSKDPTIACCFDADRLDLGRCGTRPRRKFMSTAAGRRLCR